MKVLVTGGAGFIGSAVIRRAIRETHAEIVNVDRLTYAATPEALEETSASPRYAFVQADVTDAAAMAQVLAERRPDAIMHLAAESHVDRSIAVPRPFIATNIVGAFVMLEAARAYRDGLRGPARDRFRFLHVSTDEVFGSLGAADPAFTESSPFRPNSPYAASKASADHLARAWGRTFGLPVLVSNGSNSYGKWQFPEKLVPVMISRALDGAALPVYGDGENIRDWVHVDDHARALWAILTAGRVGETYNVGGGAARRNIDVVRAICAALDALRPRADGASHARQIRFVADRPGHDQRYAVDAAKLRDALGWRPLHDFETGLRDTVAWYLANESWWRAVLARGQSSPSPG